MGRTPWSAADALVAFVLAGWQSRTRGYGSDEGVRPTVRYVAKNYVVDF